MNAHDKPISSLTTDLLMDEMLALRSAVVTAAQPLLTRFRRGADADDAAVANLAHYLALRHHDLRPLQRQMMWRGLSSLGRLESRVLPTLDAALGALAAMTGRQCPTPAADGSGFLCRRAAAQTGDGHSLRRAAGASPQPDHGHPPERGRHRPDFVIDLARRGMDIARINCAHDNNVAWRAMAANVRAAGKRFGRHLTVLMDIAGPKIRTEAVVLPDEKAKLQPGDALRLVAFGAPRGTADVPFSAAVSLPEMVTRLLPDDRLRYDDGKLEGVVESVADGEAIVRVGRTKAGGIKLKPEKGINLPDTALGLSPLTAKDEGDLASVIECADMIGYSFISRPEDIELLEGALARAGQARASARPRRQDRAAGGGDESSRSHCRRQRRRPFGVMIARGDLAAEIGFERLAEMQEEILWICEAAGSPRDLGDTGARGPDTRTASPRAAR